jgi:hypothetical protein
VKPTGERHDRDRSEGMQITGGVSVVELGPETEILQPPEEHEMWQDSVVLCWDLEQGVTATAGAATTPSTPTDRGST